MKVANAVVISSLRELGYDVKSHSSRIDRLAADLVINHLDKKKQQAEADNKNRPAGNNKEKYRPPKSIKKPPINDDNDPGWLQGSPVPKKPYPGDDDTSVRIPLPIKDIDEIV